MHAAAEPLIARREKRTGRPMKAARKGRRYQIGVIVTGETKAIITKAAKESGRTISREVEILIERALQYERTLQSMRRTLEEMGQGNVEAALWRLGYTPTYPLKGGNPLAKETGGHWKAWAEPGFPGIARSGFEPWIEAELEAMGVKQESPAKEEPK